MTPFIQFPVSVVCVSIYSHKVLGTKNPLRKRFELGVSRSETGELTQ